MPPPEWKSPVEGNVLHSDDSEAMVIANTMSGLQRLELGFGSFGDAGLDSILTKCRALSYLDIQGCWNVKLEGDLESRCMQLEFFSGLWIEDYANDSDEVNDDKEVPYSDSESD